MFAVPERPRETVLRYPLTCGFFRRTLFDTSLLEEVGLKESDFGRA
jgi:hypothetical protein